MTCGNENNSKDHQLRDELIAVLVKVAASGFVLRPTMHEDTERSAVR